MAMSRLRGQVVDVAAADGDPPGLLEPGDHAQQRGLAAPGGPDEDEELAVLDGEIDAGDGNDPSGEVLRNLFEPDVGHSPGSNTKFRGLVQLVLTTGRFDTTLPRMAAERLEDSQPESRSGNAGARDLEPTLESVRQMNEEDSTVAAVVGRAAPVLARLIDDVVERLAGGGRLVYVERILRPARRPRCRRVRVDVLGGARTGHCCGRRRGVSSSSSADRDAAEDDEDAGADAVRDLGVSERTR